MGNRGILPLILHLGTTVNFTSRPLYPPENPRYILKRSLGGLQSRSGLLEKSNTSCSYKEWAVQPLSQSLYATQEPNIHSSVMFSINVHTPVLRVSSSGLRLWSSARRHAIWYTCRNVSNKPLDSVFRAVFCHENRNSKFLWNVWYLITKLQDVTSQKTIR